LAELREDANSVAVGTHSSFNHDEKPLSDG
jgi:hypothetical protein